MKKLLTECIIVAKKINDSIVLAKNRDRAYKPKLEIVREIVNGLEVAYLRDMITDWSEGLNANGIGVINSALMVTDDEAEAKMVKKRGKPGPDGSKMRNVIYQPTIKQAIKEALTYTGESDIPLKGHIFIANPNQLVSIETTSQHEPDVKVHSVDEPVVRTNHGEKYKDAGYTEGLKYLSSKIRKISAEKVVKGVNDWQKMGEAMRKPFFGKESQLNMARNTPTMSTSSQTIINLKELVLEIEYFADKVEKFAGINNKLPKGYEPKIKIIVKKIG